MDVKKLLAEVSRLDWGGYPVHTLRLHLIDVYSLIDWFFEKTTNEYLGQNEKSVLKSIKKDNIPKPFKEALLQAEIAGKGRKKVVEALNVNGE
ncbi:MAG: hypothetical protein ACTSR3_05900 [Candidatus Helarchaeota archaeon]